jgi:hypothetical protein
LSAVVTHRAFGYARPHVGALVTQRAYARRRGVSQNAVWKRTTSAGGPIPVHGPKKRIDPTEADALWEATMAPRTAAAKVTTGATEPPAPAVAGHQLAQARAAAPWWTSRRSG